MFPCMSDVVCGNIYSSDNLLNKFYNFDKKSLIFYQKNAFSIFQVFFDAVLKRIQYVQF